MSDVADAEGIALKREHPARTALRRLFRHRLFVTGLFLFAIVAGIGAATPWITDIDPQRLSQIRNERRPGSKYADLANCRYEVSEAEAMMRRSGIRWLSSITKSIEEIATTILQEVRPERLAY